MAAALVASCGTAGASPSIPRSAPPTIVASATALTQPESTPTAEPSDPGPHRSLVGLGDSVPGGLRCNAPCRSYVLTFGELAASALGVPIVVTNLATNDGLTSATLLTRVRGNDLHRAAIADADIVTLQIGWNDWQSACNFQNHESCLKLGLTRVEPNVDAILAEVTALRAGKPTAIRVLTYYNGYLGNPQTPAIWQFLPEPADIEAFDADFRAALADFNAMLCRVAVEHEALCVAVGTAFNGPRLNEPAAPGLINADGIHGLKGGHDLIAQLLDAAGYAPLE